MADVIIADGKLTPHASVSQVTLDWACGTDENDFELTIEDPSAPEIERGWYFWLDGSDVAAGSSTVVWLFPVACPRPRGSANRGLACWRRRYCSRTRIRIT